MLLVGSVTHANRKTKIAIRASLINGDFNKFEFSYQKAISNGRSLKVTARSNAQPAVASLEILR
jgi:hypothetical protein